MLFSRLLNKTAVDLQSFANNGKKTKAAQAKIVLPEAAFKNLALAGETALPHGENLFNNPMPR